MYSRNNSTAASGTQFGYTSYGEVHYEYDDNGFVEAILDGNGNAAIVNTSTCDMLRPDLQKPIIALKSKSIIPDLKTQHRNPFWMMNLMDKKLFRN